MNGFSRYLLSTLLLLLAGTASAEIETVTWLHSDHLGSPLMARDAQGNTLWQEDYSPWGERLAAPSANSADIGYTGHYEEADIGLTYAQARWYDPAVGRFLSADAVDMYSGGAQYFNRYSYVFDSPFMSVDPDGREVKFSRQLGGNEYQLVGLTRSDVCSGVPKCLGQLNSLPGHMGLSQITENGETLYLSDIYADNKAYLSKEKELALDGLSDAAAAFTIVQPEAAPLTVPVSVAAKAGAFMFSDDKLGKSIDEAVGWLTGRHWRWVGENAGSKLSESMIKRMEESAAQIGGHVSEEVRGE